MLFVFLVALLAANLAQALFDGVSLNVRTEPTNSSVLPFHEWTGKRVMFIHAHTDDMECASGGLIAQLKGIAEVYAVIVTNGDKGCSNEAVCGNSTSAEIVAIRQAEQLNSAAILGIPAENVIFMPYEDCLLNSYPEQNVLREIVSVVRRLQPHVVFTWDPAPKFEMIPSEGWGDLGYHPDHQTSGKRVLDAVWTASLSLLWPELGPMWKIEQLYFWAMTPSRVPDFYVDITPSKVFDTKVAAFLQMKSQYAQPSDIVQMLEGLGLSVGRTAGLPLGTKAEGYNYILW